MMGDSFHKSAWPSRGGTIRFLILLLLLLVLPLEAPAEEEHGRHRIRDLDNYIKMLESEDRAQYQRPMEVISALKLQKGDAVADIGAGSGYFTVLFSPAVGAEGRVYAVDVEPGMVDYIKGRIEKEGLNNVIPILSEPNDPLLPPGSVDLVFICDTYHHLPERPDYLGRLVTALKPGGRLAIIDFKLIDTPVGPPMSMRIPKEELISEVEGANFRLVEEYDFLPYQYFLIFSRD